MGDLLLFSSISSRNSRPNRPAISLRPNAVNANARLSRSWVTHWRLSDRPVRRFPPAGPLRASAHATVPPGCPPYGRSRCGLAIANLIDLFSQTFEATAGLIGNAVLALIQHPSLHSESTSIEDLLAEVQRFDPPVQNTRRFVAAPCEIDGTRLNAGDVILVLLASANRDPQLNDNPDTFLLDRPNRRSFTFGAGRHQCPGQSLALSIAGATVRHILAMKPELDRLTWHYRPSANGRIALFKDWPVA